MNLNTSIMKKIVLALLMTISCLTASAQFEADTKYVNTSLSGLDLSYMKDNFRFGLDAKAGYFVEDAWMVYGQLGYSFNNIKGEHNDRNNFELGVGGRYYIRQNGLYLNLGLKFDHDFSGHSFNNLYLTPEVGYCFYLNHYISVEPALYYDMSLNHFSDGSKVGLRVGLGFYF